MVNNLFKCFNSYVLDGREKPIITMIEIIRKKLMRRYQLKRERINTYTGQLCQREMEELEEASYCCLTYAKEGCFEVKCHLKQYVVNLPRCTCTCRKWDMTGIPFAHGSSTIIYDGRNSKDFVD